VDKLMAWVEAVEEDGLEATRRVPGFHDEPLRGESTRPAVHPTQPSVASDLRDLHGKRR
jgi:hypothetical protein